MMSNSGKHDLPFILWDTVGYCSWAGPSLFWKWLNVLKEQLILILSRLKRFVGTSVKGLCARCVHWTRPLSSSLPLGTFADLGRSKSELIAENALLRQQLIILKRQVKRPVCTNRDRIFLVLLARAVRVWKQALFLVQAENISRDHCLEKVRWRRKIAVFGAERIRAELLKLGLRVCKRTVQKYRRSAHGSLPRGQKWRTFLHNHAQDVWACNFLQVTDLFFRSLFAFFLIEPKIRRVVHVGVSRSPTDHWAAEPLREATPYGQAPKYLMCDNDGKFGPCFTRVAATSAIEILKTPYHAKRPNTICERFVRSVRQECASPSADPP